MQMMVITKKHSYFINEEDLATVELGSLVFNPEAKQMNIVLAPGALTAINCDAEVVDTLEEIIAAIAAGG